MYQIKKKKPITKAFHSIAANKNTKWNNSTTQEFLMKCYKSVTTAQSMQIIHRGSRAEL